VRHERRSSLIPMSRRSTAAPAAEPTYPAQGSLPLGDDLDVVACRQMVRKITAGLKFSITGQTMLVTAASELGRNTVVHGGGGKMSWEVIHLAEKHGVRLRFEDSGPGIPDIKLAMTDGWTSGKSLGLGLPGAKRLVHEFEVQSTPGRGTCVVITRWK
jgi:serine/threonine-protein kinase RsbT